MQIQEIKATNHSTKRRKIDGRGPGSGHGKTSGRGHKGGRSRSGRWGVGSSEGGQVPLIRRLPKFGFRSHRPVLNQVVSLASLNAFEKDAVVNAATLKALGLIKSLNKPFKILADGEIKKSLILQVRSISKTAQEKITKAGGKIELLSKDVQQK